MIRRRAIMLLVAVAAGLVAALAVLTLERQRADLVVETRSLAESPATIWRTPDTDAAPLVVIAHGYAGSRQMMQALAITLARSGFVAVTFDFQGHGRHPDPMNGDVTSLDGATAQLVAQTVSVTRAARALPGVAGPVALVGHSMATDIVIRASAQIEDTAAVVAISMYSDAVEPGFPERLLILSGAREGRLREVALDRLQQLDPDAAEGETIRAGAVERRAVAAPLVGHVGVLYSATTLSETRDWIAGAMGRPAFGPLPNPGPWIAVLLGALVLLAWPLSGLLGRTPPPTPRPWTTALVPLAAPVLPALAAAALFPPSLLGLGAFGALTAFFGVWGGVQLATLWRAGRRPGPVAGAAGLALLLLWGLVLFAPALDRYGAAFLPRGPRLEVMGLLFLGTVPFCLGDALLTRGLGWLPRLAVRLLPLAVLLVAMLLSPRLGIAFTVLPVMILFWAVYGLAARWLVAGRGIWATGLGLGLILAWAIAASTPLVAA
ncbi:alpha/beta fold hydrolase [Jannaschia ovalis]|uniref:Alpha/beta hydrolase n=1 Tax=Jannaschia ovalis TaxID=3038773 RepID=A0ABY8LH39_9RHOB|nr:alpha/beta fold hydrolase [Jannaschia sp. GRR-S6-38]WGH79499.1 alpha/beta hydrolase [Jannaschia sp. GRR-S6-38]